MRLSARQVAAVIPLLLVNAIAITGQYEFWHSHLPWPGIAAFFFACALESIAVYLAYQAHLAQVSDDSAFRLRAGSYSMGALIGMLNASHYLHDGRVTAAAAGMGILSASSPWLWSIHSRRQNRDKLRETGLIEAHALRLGATRWLWHPLRSAQVMWHATWAGIQHPADAIRQWEESRAERAAEPQPESAHTEHISIADAANKTEAVRVALRMLPDAKAPAIASWLRNNGWDISDAYVRTVRSTDARKLAGMRRAGIHAITAGEDTGTDR